MKQLLDPGKYVVAVSGGVDSVVLLNMLIVNKLSNVELIVAHFDHGIRQESIKDRRFVQQLAATHGLPFEYKEGKLGPNVSEDTARQARYAFLQDVKEKHSAKAIVTAHHEDDVLETIMINLMRGTGRKGLSSLQSNQEIVRPLLHMKKEEIIAYANEHKLSWHEDSTNSDEQYFRNWVRANIISKLSRDQRSRLLRIYQKSRHTNQELDGIFYDLHKGKETLDKGLLIRLSHKAALELLAHWLRSHKIRSFTKKQLETLLIGAKTLEKGKAITIYGNYKAKIDKDVLRLIKE